MLLLLLLMVMIVQQTVHNANERIAGAICRKQTPNWFFFVLLYLIAKILALVTWNEGNDRDGKECTSALTFIIRIRGIEALKSH